MRILHTADWHLGRLFHGIHLTEDQSLVLDQIVEITKETKPDVMIIAGDLYDRAVPPTDAVRLLDDTLSRLQSDVDLPILMISGNHDSADRLSFGSRALAQQGLHVAARPNQGFEIIRLEDQYGPVHFYATPYADPALTRQVYGDAGIQDHDTAMQALVGRMRPQTSEGERNVLIAHTFVQGGAESESERPLSIGGASMVRADSMSGFHYVALGHLHCPQEVGSPTVRYSGSLMKYSFSEISHQKSVTLIDMDAAGACTTELIDLKPKRDLRRKEGMLEELIQQAEEDPTSDDYLTIKLLDKGALLEPMSRLRKVYPNVLHIERSLRELDPGQRASARDHRGRNDADLFGDFFNEVTGDELTQEHRDAFVGVVLEMDSQE